VAIEIIPVPDLGGADKVEVIEVCVAVGERVEDEQSLVVLETDKASMEIPCPKGGTIVSLKVKEGDTIGEGDALVELEVAGDTAAPVIEEAPVVVVVEASVEVAEQSAPAALVESVISEKMVPVPDLGGADSVDVIEVCVAVGDEVAEGDSLIVLETDKASMEIPAPFAGKVLELKVAEGAKVAVGADIALLQVEESAAAVVEAPAKLEKPAPVAVTPSPTASAPAPAHIAASGDKAYAGPSVRKLARQLGVDLSAVPASGPRSRYTKDDIRGYVKQLVADVASGKLSEGAGIPQVPEIDFSQFGDVELVKMTKLKKIVADNMTRNWLNAPHVTQFDEADITELEAFRKSMKLEAEKRGIKLTPLPFLLKAAAAALAAEPSFNVSMHADGEHIVQKSYIHIGVAVATPAGLMVPVIRDVDKKGLWELAEESNALAAKARAGKLLPRDMQGGCFTISSLGAMGGTGFTPIVNCPEVAIMGVSKAQMKPIWNGTEFIPRNMLPLSVSYDHRAINGADCGKFFTFYVSMIGDIRKLLL